MWKLCAGKAEPRHRIVEESRPSDRDSEHATRGIRSYGRFAWTGLERRERYTQKEKLPVAPERRISSVKQPCKLSLLSRSTCTCSFENITSNLHVYKTQYIGFSTFTNTSVCLCNVYIFCCIIYYVCRFCLYGNNSLAVKYLITVFWLKYLNTFCTVLRVKRYCTITKHQN